MRLLKEIKRPGSIVLCGDYGCGKTALVMSAAQRAASEGFKVFIVTATSFGETAHTSYILDVALQETFKKMVWSKEVDLTVTSLTDIRKELGLPFTCSTTDVVLKFIEVHGDKANVKIFFDDFPVSDADLHVMRKYEESDLIRMLRAIDEKSSQAFVALKTTCLLDTVYVSGSRPKAPRDVGSTISFEDLKFYIESESNFKVKVLNQMLRNTSKIGKAAVANMEEEYAMKSEGSPSASLVLEVGSSHKSIPGERPHCIVGSLGE